MAGRKFPHRHINRRALPLHGRNVDEVALYFKEMRQFAALQPTLIPDISIKALPDGAVNQGAGDQERTTGSNIEEDTPKFKVNFNPKAKRKPGQILKLHVTKNELTSKEGASFGWIDPPKSKTREELDKLIQETENSSPMNSPVFLRRYKRDIDGSLTAEIETEIRVKALGRTIGSTMGRVSTQAFQAAGGIIDADGKLRCPPGTPNANQFTDLDMSNCMAVGVGTLARSLRSVRSKFNRMVQEGEELKKFGRVLTDSEREQQETFERTRSAVTSPERIAEVARQHGEILARAIQEAGIEFDDSVAGGNFDLIMAWRSKFPAGPDGDRQFAQFLFGNHVDDGSRNVVVKGGILGDVLGAGSEGFEWEGDYSPESIKANLARYDQQIREKLTTFLPGPARDALRDPNAPQELKEAAQKLLDQVRLRHHLAQREAIGTSLVFKEKYPDAFQRMQAIRAFTEADLGDRETMWTTEGSCRPDLSDSGDLSATISFNAVNISITSMYAEASDLRQLDDGSWYIDVGNTASEAEKIAKTVEAIQQITDAFQFAESVSGQTFANESTGARLAKAFGTDAVVGRARHVMWHEIGHVFQYHAFQQKIIDVYSRTGEFPMLTTDGRITIVTDPPSLWTNDMWGNAIWSLQQGKYDIDFPPGGLKTFEKDLVHLFAGKYYQDELDKAVESGNYGVLRTALTEGSTEIFAQREMGLIEGPAVDNSIRWFLPEEQTYTNVSSIPYEVPPRRDIEEISPASEPDIPTSTGDPRGGSGNTTIYNGPVINGPVNITIINGSGVKSDMDTPSSDIDRPRVDESGNIQPIDIAWSDVSGHIFMDEDTQWSPEAAHNIDIEQNPDEIRRIVDATFGFGPDLGGPDPSDRLGAIRQKKDAYWKMGPETLDARFEALNGEFIRLRDKSMNEPLSSDEQARMWLAIKGMRQILDVNTRKSKMSDDDISRYEARGFDPRPGKYMRKVDSKSKPQQKRFRQYAIDKRRARGFDGIEEVDDDELTHWSREIGHHVGDSADGRPDFDGSARPYDPDNIRNSRGMSIKEKRRRNPEYQPTEDEKSSATVSTDPEIYGQRKIDQIAERANPEQRALLQKSESAESSPIVSSVTEHASNGSASELTDLIDRSARSRLDQRAGLPSGAATRPEQRLVEDQIRQDLLPLLDLLDSSAIDEDMSIVASFELQDDLTPGQIIDHGGPLRGLLVPGQNSENFTFASPSSSKRAIIVLPKGTRAMHAKNGHNGDADGMILPPGSLEVMRVDPDGTVLLMPSGQKTSQNVIDDTIKAFDSVNAPAGSPAAEEIQRAKSMLLAERNNRSVPMRSTRGSSGDPVVSAKADIRSNSIHQGFAKTGSDFFGTSRNNGTRAVTSELPQNLGGNGSTTFVFLRNQRGRLEDLLGPNSLSWLSDMDDTELEQTLNNSLFRFHEAFDDRPRMLVNVDRFGELIESGKLSNIAENKPNSIVAKTQKSFESANGLSDSVPNAARSHFGFISHAANEKEIQDFLDEMPHDGMIREARFFSSADGINQYGDMRSGGNNIELVLKPEVAKRTAYAKGNIMSGAVRPTPVLSTDRDQVRNALLANLNNEKSTEEFTDEIADALIMAQSGNMVGFGSGVNPSSRSSRSRTDGTTFEAVIGGGVNLNDVEQIKIDVQNLESVPVSADELGGRDELIRLISDAGVSGDIGAVVDALLRGDSLDSLPDDAKFLHTTFERVRAHKAAVAYTAKMREQYGDSIGVLVTNPDGIDLTTVDSFTDLPSIDKQADDATKLLERLRYDIYGAKMRTLRFGSAEREYYKVNGRLPVSEPHVVYTKPGALTPDSPVQVDGPVGVRKPPRNRLEPWFGKTNQRGRYSVIDDKSPGWKDSDVALVEYDPTNGDLHVVSKSTGEIKVIHNVEPLEVVQLSQGVDDSGGFESIDGGIKRIINRIPEREMTDGVGKREQVAKRSRRDRVDGSAARVITLLDEELPGFGSDRPAKRITPRGKRGPVAKLNSWSDEELIAELDKYSEYGFRPWDTSRRPSPFISSELGDSGAPSLNDLVRELDSRGYDVVQSQGNKPRYFGDYSSGDKIISARRRVGGSEPQEEISSPGVRSARSSRRDNRSNTQKTFEDAVSLGAADDPSSGLHLLDDDELRNRFNAERTGRVSVSDGTEVFRVDDIDTAAALIAAGYHVELGNGAKPAQLVGASAKLQKEIDAIIPELRRRLGRDDAGFGTIDTCRLYKAGSNIFCEGGLGTFREDMPQLSGRAKGDDALVVGAMKGGVVKTKWSGGRRRPDGTLEKLTPEESARFNELKARHASPKGPGDLSPEELEEFYSLVDWNDTEADLTPAFKDFVRRITGREDAIQTVEGILPSTLSASQGQIQMGKTGGMVISMQNHDYSFDRYMAENFPNIKRGSDEYFDHRDAWLYRGTTPDGSELRITMHDVDGDLIDKDGNKLPAGTEPFVLTSKPWYTDGSIISTSDGFVVDGHHRWASFMAYNEGKPEREQLRITSEVMDMPIDDALSVGKIVQDHWGIKPAVLGRETFFKGDAANVPAIDADRFTREMADIRATSQDRIKDARNLYFKKEGFGFTESRADRVRGGGVRVQREVPISSRSAREQVGSRGRSGDTTPGSKRSARDKFEDVISLGAHDDENSGLHTLSDEELDSRFSATRTDLLAASDGMPVYRVDDVESAAALLAAGYHVELGDNAKPKKLVRASSKLQKEIDKIIPELRQKYGRDDAGFGTIDTCRLYKAGTNIFCSGGLGTFREDMPQLSGRAKGDDAVVVGAMKAGRVATDWKPGRRKPDGSIEQLTPEEQKRFDELSARHAKTKNGTFSPGDLTDEEKAEFYSLVDWNDTEADLLPEFRKYVASVTGRPDAIRRRDGLDPNEYNASQGQIQMGKTAGMVISMENHDYSFSKWMRENHPEIDQNSDEFFEWRAAWLYGREAPDGSRLQIPLYDTDGTPLDKNGNPFRDANGNIIKDAEPGLIGQPWFTKGSIIVTKDGFVVDGHHRWASFVAYNEDLDPRARLKINAEEMDMPIDEALSIGKIMQDHWGIKPAVLGKETFFKGDGANAPELSADELEASQATLIDEAPSRMPAARDLYVQKEGFGLTESRVGKVRGGGVRVRRERVGGATSSRSSRSSSGLANPRTFSTDYPMMSRIGITPRPDSGNEDSSLLRSEAERLLSGASIAEMKRAEKIAEEAINDVEARREEIISSIVETIGSREAFDDLLDFEKPTPRAWTDLSDEQRQSISDSLREIQQFETERFDQAKERIAEARDGGRAARAIGIEKARGSNRSTRTDAIKNSVPLDRVGNDLAAAFANRGTAGVMSKLRSMLKNDSSGWAVDYAIERGYISESQGKILKNLAKGLIKRVILPGLASRKKQQRRKSRSAKGRRS